MSADTFKIEAKVRDVAGKGASRRLRNLAGLVPGIVYGGSKDPVQITVAHRALAKHLENEAFYSHIVDLAIDGASESVILKDVQRHPAKDRILHIDFMRVSKTRKIAVSVPLHFLNESTNAAVKAGGIVAHTMTQLDITCLPGDLPEFIEVDLDGVEVGQILHVSDLKLPKGVEAVVLTQGADHDLPVVSINKPKGSAADADDESAPAAE